MARESETAEAPAAEAAAPQEQAQQPVVATEELAAAAVEEQQQIAKRLSTPADGDAAASRPGTATSSSASATLPEVKDLVADVLRRTSTLTVEVRAKFPGWPRIRKFCSPRSAIRVRCDAAHLKPLARSGRGPLRSPGTERTLPSPGLSLP